MRHPSRPSRADDTGVGAKLRLGFAVVFVLGVVVVSLPARAQVPTRPATPVPTEINSDISACSTVANLGSSFLERLGNQATSGFGLSLIHI